jgi:hypothetical protein
MPRLVPPPTHRQPITTLGDNPTFQALKERLEAPPPETELVKPRPNTHRDKVLGPAKRDASDPRNIYRGPNVRLDLMDGDTFHMELAKPLPRYKQNLAVAAGFDPIGDADTALAWQASRENAQGHDVSLLAARLDDKSQRIGR